MKMNRKRFLSAALAALMVLSLTACGKVKVSDGEIDLTGEPPTDETTSQKWGTATTDGITLPEDMDSAARFATELVDNSMYVVFNGIQKRDTGYFSAPNGSLTFTVNATAEAENLQKFKIAVWQLVDGGTQYIDGTTVYYTTDGTNYTYTVEGLDPSARFRLTFSYDKTKYYMYGQVRVDGVGEMGAAPDESDSNPESVA